jgi:hypothetical protein
VVMLSGQESHESKPYGSFHVIIVFDWIFSIDNRMMSIEIDYTQFVQS